jgi:hypothetical protein
MSTKVKLDESEAKQEGRKHLLYNCSFPGAVNNSGVPYTTTTSYQLWREIVFKNPSYDYYDY